MKSMRVTVSKSVTVVIRKLLGNLSIINVLRTEIFLSPLHQDTIAILLLTVHSIIVSCFVKPSVFLLKGFRNV